MEIRRATVRDWETTRALRLAALADTPDAFATTLAAERDQPDVFWQDRLRNPRAVTLIAHLDGPVGLAVVAPWGSTEDAGLYSVWVAPEARGHGVGQALVGAAIEVARERGHPRLRLEVGDHNEAAVRLYDRMGFERTGGTGTLPPPRTHLREHERALDLRPRNPGAP